MPLNIDYLENSLFYVSEIQGPLKRAVKVTSSLSKAHKYNPSTEMFSVDAIKKNKKNNENWLKETYFTTTADGY